MESKPREAKKASVQSIAKKIGEQVRKAQSLAGSPAEGEAFEKTLVAMNKRAKTLQAGLAKLPESNEALRSSGDKLNASVFLFVEAARKARANLASGRGAMDRAAFDVHSILSAVKREAAAVARDLAQPELELRRSTTKSGEKEQRERAGTTDAAGAVAEGKDSGAKKIGEKTEPKLADANLRASAVLSRSSTAGAVDPAVSPEEGRKKARVALEVLRATAAAGEDASYREREKECALHLSIVIRHLKANLSLGGKAAAEALLQETQRMVALGRAAVAAAGEGGANLQSAAFKSQFESFKSSSERVSALLEPEPPRPTRQPPPPANVSPNVAPQIATTSDDPPRPARGAPTIDSAVSANVVPEPQKPLRAPPPSQSPRAVAGGGAEKQGSQQSTVNAAVGAENAKVQLVAARKTTAAAELMRAHGIDQSELQSQAQSNQKHLQTPPEALLSPRELRRREKEAKKAQKSEEKKSIAKRRKERVRRASVSLSNEEKAQLARGKLEHLREEEERKKKQLVMEEEEERRLRRAEEEQASRKREAEEQDRKRQEEEKKRAEAEELERRRKEDEKREETKKAEEERRKREEEEKEQRRQAEEEEQARAELERRRREEEEEEKLEEERRQRLLELELRSKQEEDKKRREEEQRAREEEEEKKRLAEAARQKELNARQEEEDRKRQMLAEEEERKRKAQDEQSALEASIREKEERLRQAKARKKEEERQAQLERMRQEKERLQREKELELQKLAEMAEAEARRVRAEEEAQRLRELEQERLREQRAMGEARQREAKRHEDEVRKRAVEEMERMEREIQERNEAKERAAREAAALELAALRSEEERKRRELQARLQEEEEQRRAQRERERQEEEAIRRKAEIESQRLKLLEEQRLAAAKKQKDDEEARRSKRATSQAANAASPLMRQSQSQTQQSPIVPVPNKKGVVLVRLCEDCGQEAGPDPYCDACAGTVVEVEVEESAFRKFSVPAAAAAAQPRKTTKPGNGSEDSEEEDATMRVCCECGEEAGKERFCVLCGGEVIGLDCDDLELASPGGQSMDTVQIYDNVAALERELGLRRK